MILQEQAILRVRFQNGGFAWYRVKPKRNLQLLFDYFINNRPVLWAKLYAYDRNSKQVMNELGYFGVKQSTGEVYRGGLFSYI